MKLTHHLQMWRERRARRAKTKQTQEAASRKQAHDMVIEPIHIVFVRHSNPEGAPDHSEGSVRLVAQARDWDTLKRKEGAQEILRDADVPEVANDAERPEANTLNLFLWAATAFRSGHIDYFITDRYITRHVRGIRNKETPSGLRAVNRWILLAMISSYSFLFWLLLGTDREPSEVVFESTGKTLTWMLVTALIIIYWSARKFRRTTTAYRWMCECDDNSPCHRDPDGVHFCFSNQAGESTSSQVRRMYQLPNLSRDAIRDLRMVQTHTLERVLADNRILSTRIEEAFDDGQIAMAEKVRPYLTPGGGAKPDYVDAIIYLAIFGAGVLLEYLWLTGGG